MKPDVSLPLNKPRLLLGQFVVAGVVLPAIRDQDKDYLLEQVGYKIFALDWGASKVNLNYLSDQKSGLKILVYYLRHSPEKNPRVYTPKPLAPEDLEAEYLARQVLTPLGQNLFGPETEFVVLGK